MALNTNPSKMNIMVIENEKTTTDKIAEVFRDAGYSHTLCADCEKALNQIKQPPNIVLMSITMADHNMHHTRLFDWATLNKCPIIFLTQSTNEQTRKTVFEKRGADYIAKPIVKEELLRRVENILVINNISRGAKSYEDYLHETFFNEYTRQLDNTGIGTSKAKSYAETQFAIIELVSGFVQIYRNDSKRSIKRVQLLSAKIARYLAVYNKFEEATKDDFIANITLATALYDCGMAAVQQRCLNSDSKLKDREREEVRKHTMLGSQMLAKIKERFPKNAMLSMAMDIATFHHERFDGSGYPHGISGYDIPLSARIVAVADVYDALISSAAYREKYTVQGAINTITGMWKRQFDPDVLEAFLEVVDKKQDQLERSEI